MGAPASTRPRGLARSRRALAALLHAAAWVVVAATAAGLALERSGWIEETLRERARGALAGFDVDFARARVLWLRPGVLLEEVSLGAFGASVTFESVEVHVALLSGRVDGVDVRGGRARISEDLQRGLRRAFADRGGEPEAESVPRELPTLALTDFRLDLELPGGGVVPLGQIDLLVAGRDDGGARVSGRWLDLPGSSGVSPVRLAGTVEPSGEARVVASAVRLPVDSDALPSFLRDPAGGLERARGVLTVEAGAALHLRGGASPSFYGRLELSEGSAATAFAEAPVEDVRARIDVAWTPGPDDGLWSERAWDGRAEVAATWNGNAARAWALAGRSAGADALRVWAVVPELALDEERRGGLDLGDEFGQLVDALDLWGAGELTAGFSLPHLEVAPGEDLVPSCAVDLRPSPGSGVRYVGFRDEAGERWGVPIPATVTGGRILWALQSDRERPQRVALVNLAGDHSTGRVRADLVAASPPRGAPPDTSILLDLDLRIPSIALDDVAREGLAGMPVTRGVFDDYSPRDGTLATRWHLQASPETDGLTAQGEVTMQLGSAVWSRLPAPLADARAHLSLRWSDRATEVEGRTRGQRWRAHGLALSASGRLAGEGGGAPIQVEVAFRNESPLAAAVPADALPRGGVRLEEVLVRDAALEGDAMAAARATLSPVDDVARALRPAGTADVLYRAVAAREGAPHRFAVEVTARAGRAEPERLGLPVELSGTAVVTGLVDGGGAESPPRRELALRGSFAGLARTQGTSAPHSFALAARVAGDAGSATALELYGAGIDPSARGVRRALREALSLPETPAEAETRIAGRVDAGIAAVLSTDAPPPTARIELRQNSLLAGRLRLDDLRGELRFDGGVLAGDALAGRLAGSPVQLTGFRLFSAREARERDFADPRLRRPGFLGALDAPVVQTDLSAVDLPLDEELLGSFFDAETVHALVRKAELRGRLDVERARLLMVPAGEQGGLRIALDGSAVPHNAQVRFGLPVQISSGRVQIDELLVEPEGTRARAHVRDLFARVAGRSVERASMILSLVESRLSVDALDGSLEGGSLSGLGAELGGPALSVDLVEPYFFTTALQISGVDANGLLRGMFETSVADKGIVDGWARLSGTPDDVLGLRGMGRLGLSEARLWSIPVLRALFSKLGFDGTTQFDQMDARFRLEDGVLSMTDIDARSPLLHLVGAGTIDFDGRLHHDLEVQYGLVNRLGPLKVLLYWIQNSILRVAIRGTLWRPEIVLRNAFRDFFYGAPGDSPSLPLPPPTPLPRRF